MPDAIITSTASTFGTITGTFAADQSTITGTVAGSVVGTLTGSVGVPGPQGPAGPGSTWGGIVGTLSDQTDLQSALDAKQNVSGMSAYLTKAGNLSGLTDLTAARDNLGLGSLSTPTFAGVNVPGSGTSVANLGATFLTLNQQGSGQFTIQPSQGIVFPDATIQTTAYPGPAGATAWGTITGTLSSQTDLQTALNLKAPLASPVFTGDARAVTAALGDNDTSIATTAFVQQELLSGTANARNLEVYVRNQTGSTIPSGSIVYINGATGNRPTITLAQANNDANSAQTFGFTKASIANNGFGFVIVRGELENIDTSALTEGVQLYLSPTTPGTWTTTKPSAPQHLVYVGICVRAHPTQGVILVAVQNGYELEELHDVSIVSKANNDLLAYESSTNLWKNKSFGTLGLLTSSSLTGYATESWVTAGFYPLTGNPSGFITSSALTPYLTSATAASTYQTLSGMSAYLTTSAAASSYYPLTGNPSGFITSSALTGYATESWVTSQGYLTSSALTGYATESFVTSQGYLTDAPSDGNQYARKNGAWDVVSAGTSYISSVTSPLSVTSGDLSIDLSSYLTSATAASTYQTLSGMSSYLTTSAAASTYAPLASPALTGNVSIVSNSTGAALFIEQSGTGNILTLHDQASDTNFVAIDQNGKVNTIPSVTASAGFNVPHGTAPTSPANGDLWTTTSGLFMRQNGSTQQYVDFGGTQTISGAKTFSNASQTLGNSTAAGTINIGTGATISGATKAINIGTGGVSGSTTTITIGSTLGTTTTFNGDIAGTFRLTGTSITLGNSSAASVTNIATGGVGSGVTKSILIGTGGLTGSTTNITIGSTAGSGGTSFQGTVNLGDAANATTATAGTSTTQVATTAFVTTADNLKANLASPTFTGTPAAPTAAVDTNTTQLATTAYVVGQGYLKSATASTTYAPLASPALTGTPTAPTATAGTNTTQIATTAFVTAALPALATTSDSRQFTNDTKAMSPRDVLWSMLSQDFVDINGSAMTVTNTGTITSVQVGQLSRAIRPSNAGACSSRIRTFGTSQVDQTWTASSRAQPSSFLNFSLRSIHSGRSTTSGVTDANYTCAVYYGKAEADGTGDLIRRGYGWKMVGGAGSRFLQLQAHNGTTLSSVTSSFAVTAGVAFDWDIESDGAGNVTLYVNGSSVATSTGGPTGAVNITGVAWQEEVVAAAALSSPFMDFVNSRGRYIVINTW